jgi:hypothetical protein
MAALVAPYLGPCYSAKGVFPDGGKTFERDDHLPSIKYYDSSADAERVHFAFNEK